MTEAARAGPRAPARPLAPGRRARRTLRWAAARALSYLLITLVALVVLFPLLWYLSATLREPGRFVTYPPQWIPDPIVLTNYEAIFASSPFLQYMLNSAKVTLLATLGQLVACSMAAFAFARLRFPGRGPLFALFLATLMIPRQLTIIPTFLLMRQLGWINTHEALIVPAWGGGAFGIFLLRQFFLTLPAELADAAKIDGCAPPGVFWHVTLPLAKPALTTLGVFTFLHYWNDLFYPLIFLSKQRLLTVPIGLLELQGNVVGLMTGIPTMVAASMLSILPTLVLYVLAQRYFVEGVATSGLKR
jgi:ABC-type glycerol-3-phosphate transport system permease component